MRWDVQFRIGNRLGAKSRYSPREVCIHLVESYSLKDREVEKIFTLKPGEKFENEDMVVTKAT